MKAKTEGRTDPPDGGGRKPWGAAATTTSRVGRGGLPGLFPRGRHPEALKAIRHEYDPESLYLAPLPL